LRTHRGVVLLATVLCLLSPGSAAAERLAPDAEVRAILKERVDGRVTSLVLHQNGWDAQGKKVK
jgi:hypothetical protein